MTRGGPGEPDSIALREGSKLLFPLLRSDKNAFTECSDRADRCWRRVVHDQPVHSDGVQYQDDSERRSRGWCLCLAASGGWTLDKCDKLSSHEVGRRGGVVLREQETRVAVPG